RDKLVTGVQTCALPISTLFSTVPFLLFLYGGTQVAWWIVLRPIRDRTKAGSLSVATDVDESERVYDDTVQSPNPDTNPGPQPARSEERRVGKECRHRGERY